VRNVFTAQSPAEAHLVAGLLDEAGIECVVEGEMLTGARMGLPMDSATLPGVFVRDEDAARALALIAERHLARAAPAGTSGVAEDEDLDAERAGIFWFKRLLLALIVFLVASFLIALLFDLIVWLAGTRPQSDVGAVISVWGGGFVVACATAWLVLPRRRARR
jgi:hypothetical protein